jgi:2-iminobutanoate/2-iminopropanoate deaminase
VSRTVVAVDKPWVNKSAFSQGVIVEGRMLFTAGITARDPDGNLVGAGDIRAQIEQCFRNVGDVLREAGADYGDVIKWTMYTTDIEAFGKHADLYRSYFIDNPASTLLEVSRMVVPDMLVEIEAIVVLPEGSRS